MIRKTVKVYERIRTEVAMDHGHTIIEGITKTTWWFLFIPFFTAESIRYENFRLPEKP